MSKLIERRVAKKCYEIACQVRDAFTTDITDDNWRKHSGAAHVAHAIKEYYGLDRVLVDEEEEND